MSDSAFFDVPQAASVEPAPEPQGLVQVTTHAQDAVAHLIEFFRNGPRNQVLVKALADEVQLLEDVLWTLLSAFDLDSAVGAQLDVLGKILQEARDNREDDDYRAALRVQVLVLSSNGTPEELYRIVLTALPDARATLTEFTPRGITLEVLADFSSVAPSTLVAKLRAAKAAGVRLDLVTTDTSDSLIWSAKSRPDAVTGWGSDTDPDLGGAWASVV